MVILYTGIMKEHTSPHTANKTPLEGLTAVVTGSSRGIGRAIALGLAEAGCDIALVARKKAPLEKVAGEIASLGRSALPLSVNLEEVNSGDRIVKETIQRFKRLDILVNNAGMAQAKPILETEAEEWDRFMRTNARAPFLLCRAAIPYLKNSENATIINVTSVVGRKGYIHQAAYTASKHALRGFTKVLAQEVQELGIRVHIIAPGGVATDMVAQTRPDLDESVLISPKEIAETVLFLLTHRRNAVIDEINIRRAVSRAWK